VPLFDPIKTQPNPKESRISVCRKRDGIRVQSLGFGWMLMVDHVSSFFALRIPALSRCLAYIRFSGWSMDKNCQTVHHLFLPQLLPNSLVFPGTLNQSIRAANRTLAMVPTSLVESF
jgi:hypothetical protein